jgi:hypothetical protein
MDANCQLLHASAVLFYLNHELFNPRLFYFIMPANNSDIPRDKRRRIHYN